RNTLEDIDFSSEPIKPPYSYAELITLAMRHHGQSKVLLSDIYEYVRKNFAWYRKTDITWQNSIRHNLSLNKQFIKLPRRKGEKGKGSYWMLDCNAMDSSGFKMKKNGSTNSKMKVLESGCKPTLNPAILSYLKKQNASAKPSNLNNLRLINITGHHQPEIMETGGEEAIRLSDTEFTSAIDENTSNFHLSSLSPSAVSSLTEYEHEQELLQITDPWNSCYHIETVNEQDKSPVWWKNDENSTLRNSPDFGQQSALPRFTDAFANGSVFEHSINSNVESGEHPWQEADLKITDECLFF
ncbi:unnamed protein product, partial [Litomosoides sigmodontis]